MEAILTNKSVIIGAILPESQPNLFNCTPVEYSSPSWLYSCTGVLTLIDTAIFTVYAQVIPLTDVSQSGSTVLRICNAVLSAV